MAIWADNSLAWLECWLGASLLGAVTVAVNPRLTAREAGALMEATDVGHLLAGGRTLPGVTELVDSRQAPETTLAIDGSPGAAVARALRRPVSGGADRRAAT